MTRAPPPGRFITLEGGEGVGKSTQLRAVAAALRQRGLEVVESREPGGTANAEAVRALLMTGSDERWSAAAEALLFAAARSDHVSQLIRPALARGAWVICDRFVDSTRAYQGGGGGISDAEILAIHTFGSGGLLPDRTVLLSLDPAAAAARRAARDGAARDRMDRKPPDYHARLAARFAAMAAAEPQRWRVVDASGDAAAVTAAVLAALVDLR